MMLSSQLCKVKKPLSIKSSVFENDSLNFIYLKNKNNKKLLDKRHSDCRLTKSVINLTIAYIKTNAIFVGAVQILRNDDPKA